MSTPSRSWGARRNVARLHPCRRASRGDQVVRSPALSRHHSLQPQSLRQLMEHVTISPSPARPKLQNHFLPPLPSLSVLPDPFRQPERFPTDCSRPRDRCAAGPPGNPHSDSGRAVARSAPGTLEAGPPGSRAAASHAARWDRFGRNSRSAALIQQLSSRPIALSAVALESATVADACINCSMPRCRLLMACPRMSACHSSFAR